MMNDFGNDKLRTLGLVFIPSWPAKSAWFLALTLLWLMSANLSAQSDADRGVATQPENQVRAAESAAGASPIQSSLFIVPRKTDNPDHLCRTLWRCT